MHPITITSNDLLTIDEARQILGYSRVHLWRLTKRGVFRPIYLGNRPFYTREEVENYKKETSKRG